MSLTVYRRHGKGCIKQRPEHDRIFRRCHCPLWAEGMLNDKWVRRSLKMTDLQRAEQLVSEWESAGQETDTRTSIAGAVAMYLASCEKRSLAWRTLRGYRSLLSMFLVFCQESGLTLLGQLNFSRIYAFRESWPSSDAPKYINNKINILKGLFNYCIEKGWIQTSPVDRMKSIKYQHIPTQPYSPEEMNKILDACDTIPLRTLVLVMRYSGLRLGDAYSLSNHQIVEGCVFLYTAKTSTPVRVPLPQGLLDALQGLDVFEGGYYFWRRRSTTETFNSTSGIAKKLKRVFVKAGIVDGHSHRFRDTFAVELLKSGVSIDTVSILLGHTNVQITQRHYAPWVADRQRRLEEAVRGTWS